MGELPLHDIVAESRDGRDILWLEPNVAAEADHRGFDHLELCNHVVSGNHMTWLREQVGWHRAADLVEESAHAFMGAGPVEAHVASDTGAFQALYSGMPPELHSSMWAVDRVLSWIDSLPSERPFFCWLSFDDPHHPFNPPAAYGRRHNWQELALPAARGRTREEIERQLDGKPWQYGAYWRGEFSQHEGAHAESSVCQMPDDQLREITALTYGMVELIDDALGRLLDGLRGRGREADTHLLVTTDHGELLGDHGLVLKGPFHLEGLMRVPLIWHAPGREAGVMSDPVGLVDVAPTCCSIAGIDVPEWMDGAPLPQADGSRERVTTVFDSAYRPELRLRTLYRDGYIVTIYPVLGEDVGELYDLHDDPHQFVNRWNDPSARALRDDLVDDLRATLVDEGEERLKWWAHA
jgi:arylsulfatase A-like enzyme